MKPPRTRRFSAPRPRASWRRFHVEPLEARELLSVQPAGGEFQVNSYTPGDQSLGDAANYAAASDADGDRVVAWSSLGQDGDSWGIYAQRYRADGSAAGGEFRVNSTTAGAQLHPAVAVDPDGDFVIAWASQGQDGSGYGVFAQRFDAAGVKRGNELRVNATTSGNQAAPAVAMDGAGNFVVAWSSPQDGDQEGIVARLFDDAGMPRTGEVLINATTAGQQRDPVAARNLQGEITIAWVSTGQDGDGDGVVARRLDATGALVGDEIAVNQYTAGAQNRPALAMSAAGDFAVAWESAAQDGDGQGIVVRRFGRDGVALADETIANTTTAGDQSQPTLALSASSRYIVAWTSRGQDGDGAGVYAQILNGDGSHAGSELPINTTTVSDQERPSIALDDLGSFVVAWQSAHQDGDGLGVFAQRFLQDDADMAAPVVGGLYLAGDTHRVTPGQRLLTAPTEMVITFSEAMSDTDGAAGAASVLNPANYRLTLFGADYSAAIASVTYGLNATTNRYEATVHFATPLPRGEYSLSVLPTIADASGNLLDGDLDGTAGGDYTIHFQVAEVLAAGGEMPVNTATDGDQAFTIGAPGTIASDHAGNYAVTWASINQDGSGWGIYAQRFSAAGEKLGDEFRVNTYTTNHQRFSTIAMDADGDFVITWSSLGQDGNNYGVYGQRFDKTGAPAGGEFRVNTTTAKFQGRSTVAMDDDGDFVIAWESTDQDGSGVGVYYQLYAADGAPRGVETRANTITASHQRLPHVAMDGDGDFVITWSGPPDGSGYGIYARRFNADGAAQGAEFLANTLTAGNQQDSTVAMDDDGDFVVAWHSSTGDGVFYGVYAQRFTAQGEKFGSQFLVNSFTANFQQFPSVAMDANGDFVVTWQSLTQDGSVWGVYGQRYSWGGGRVGGEFPIHTTTADSQNAPSAAMTPNGDFVVTWQSLAQDGSGWGIYAQRYAGETNHAPNAAISGAYELAEGDTLALDASGSNDADFGQVLTFAWDLNNDGIFGDAVGATPSLTWEALAALGIADDGVYPVAVRVDDGYGGTSAAASTVTVHNAAPTGLAIDPLAPVNEGAGVLLTGTFADPGGADIHTFTIDWGDGSQEQLTVPAGARSFQFAHTYRDDHPSGTPSDSYVIRVSVADDDGGATEPVETSAVVYNIAPTLEDLQFSKIVLDEGETFTITGRVSDAGADDTHTITFAWSEGDVQTIEIDPVTRTFSVTHAYPDNNPAGSNSELVHFRFTLADDDHGESITDAAVTVRNVAPRILDLQQSATAVDEGGVLTITGRLDDPGVNDVLSLEFHWGDGTSAPVDVDPVTRTFTATHTYVDDDPTGTAADAFTITIRAADDDLGSRETQSSVTIHNVAPTAEIEITPTPPFGQREFTAQAIVQDAGLSDTFTYSWEIHRGLELVATGTEGLIRYLPSESGTYTVSLHVTDDDGGAVTASKTLNICLLFGDTNNDCIVDLADLNEVRNYFGASRDDVEWQDFVGRLPGDANDDGVVGLDDLNLVRNHFGEVASSSTPRPTQASLSAAAAPSSGLHLATKAADAVFASYAGRESALASSRWKKLR